MKNFHFLILSLILSTTSVFAQTNPPADVDPDIAQAILDASKASSGQVAEDPIKSVVDDQAKAKEAAKKLKELGNQVPEVKQEPKPVIAKPVVKGPEVISKEEQELLKQLEKKNAAKENQENTSEEEDESSSLKKKKAIYIPAPVEDGKNNDGYLLERDSTRVVTKTISYNDALNVKMCFAAGLNIALDADISDELQEAILDDKIYFDSQVMENKRGVYIRLKKPVPEGKHWESAIRLVRKSDDKTYLVNLIGLPCPSVGLSTFPKVIYLKDHIGAIQANSKVLTPEDTIIAKSKGLPRIQKNRIRVYDMIMSSSSSWSVFGLEVQYPNAKSSSTMPRVVMLDSLQVQELQSKLEYLPIHSQKATQIRGVPTLRFKLSINIAKNYVVKRRYLHLMFIDEEAGHYQYIRVDTLPYFLSLLKRNFDL